jgi:hypothetical protein
VSNETRNGGVPSGRTSTTEDELRADERALVAFFHFDAARCAEALGDRTAKVGRVVESFGHVDPRVRALRLELQRFTRLTCRLFDFQFTDLD